MFAIFYFVNMFVYNDSFLKNDRECDNVERMRNTEKRRNHVVFLVQASVYAVLVSSTLGGDIHNKVILKRRCVNE